MLRWAGNDQPMKMRETSRAVDKKLRVNNIRKTFQTVTALEAKKKLGMVKRGLVLAKASLLFNWRDEILKFTNEVPVVIAGSRQQRTRLYNELQFGDNWMFIIMSYETFRNDIKCLELLDNYKPLDFIVGDEFHKAKNPTSGIGSKVHAIPFKYKYLLTATPLPNKPIEAYNYLKMGGVVGESWWNFQHKYAIFGGYNDKEIIAYKNVDKLREMIQTNMLRRLKRDKLPPITFNEIRISMTSRQNKLYKAIVDEIVEDLKDTTLESVPNALAKLTRLQQVTGSAELLGLGEHEDNSAKIQALDDLLETLIDDGGEKVVVFSRFKSLVDILEKRYKEKYNPAVIHGGIDSNGLTREQALRIMENKDNNIYWGGSDEKEEIINKLMTSERQKQVYKFQGDDSCKLFIGTSGACREGLTLTASPHCVFMDNEMAWDYKYQAYSRVHRIGQGKEFVVVHDIICTGTIDEKIKRMIEAKRDMNYLMLDTRWDADVNAKSAYETLMELIE